MVGNLGKAGFETNHDPHVRILEINCLEMKTTYTRHHESLESPIPGLPVPTGHRPLRQEFRQLAEFDSEEEMCKKTLLRRK